MQHRALLVFAMGHFTVDMFGGLMPVLYALMADEFDLSNADIGLIALAYTAASSLSQPLFGYLADRFGSRYFAVASMMWSAGMVGLAGLAPSYAMLIVISALAGLGSGAYHPQGASNAAAVSGEMRRNTALSVYTVGGTSGYALGPVLGALIFFFFGRYGTLVVAPFGFIIALLMLQQLRQLGLGVREHHASQRAIQGNVNWKPLLIVLSVVMLRSWVTLSVVTFIPVWFKDLGYSATFYSILATSVLAFGAVGTITGGILADRIGQRAVLSVSLVCSAPALILFAAFPGPLSFLFGPLFGFFVEMGLSITLVMAQRLLPGRVGVASGFILGIGFVTGGIGAPITGAVADDIGTGAAIMLMAFLIVAAAAIATRIPRVALQQPRQMPASTPEPAT
ncbi:MAG TPA: MFS transporter [Thermomicrobiales bacterium]|nr:MFS transporter [Thermomicrobiales bacterium]